jgi:leader peptidase (prepilin peptidase) / N-methyltransferase
LITRADDLMSIFSTRSRCEHCGTKLAWYDLVPVVSFMLLKARCRYCDKPISWQYPIIELSTGAIFALLYYYVGLNAQLFYYCIVFSILFVIAVYDLRTQYVPEIFVWIALGLSCLGWLFGNFSFGSMLIGGLISGGFLALLVVFSKERGMGIGDIKVGVILGFLLGLEVSIFGILLSFVSGALIGLLLMAIGRRTVKDAIPFTPFIILSTFIALLFGRYVVNWYLGISLI